MRKFFLLIAAALMAAGCTATQIQTAQTDISAGIAAACTDVTAAQASAAKLAPTNAQVASLGTYATAACGTATAVAALVQNSATLQWLGTLQGHLSATAAAVAPAAPAAPAAS